MQNALNIILLISAIFTCLALGIGMAYVLCNAMFAAMRMRAPRATVAAKVVAAEVVAPLATR